MTHHGLSELIVELPNHEIAGTRGVLAMAIRESQDGLYVEAGVFDGSPGPLQTPEGTDRFDTTAQAIAWAEGYARQFLPETRRLKGDAHARRSAPQVG